MPESLHPGVYVSEIASGGRTIPAASTSTACFIGETEKGRAFSPTGVTSFPEFTRVFGGLVPRRGPHQRDLPLAARHFFENGGTRLYVVRVIDVRAKTAAASIEGLISLKAGGPGSWGNKVRLQLGVNAEAPSRADFSILLETEDGTPAEVERFAALGFDPDEPKYFASILNRDSRHVSVPKDSESKGWFQGSIEELGLVPGGAPGGTGAGRTVVFAGGDDGPEDRAPLTAASLAEATSSLDRCSDISLLAVPGVADSTLLSDLIAWVRERRDLMLILDAPGDQTEAGEASARIREVSDYRTQLGDHDYAALYFPWLEVPDPYSASSGATRFAPPSGFIAGLYARIDNSRGVWKAPAGTEATIAGAVGVAVRVSDTDQDGLNPVGINAIRQFSSAGIVCWGARTLASPGSEFLYVPVRRTAIFLRKSLSAGTQWAVFEPNDSPLWSSIEAEVAAFMQVQFRSGAFQGAQPKEAFFVKCDSSNNYEATIEAGELHLMVGFAPLKPSEFVLLQITQRHPGA